MLWKKLCYQRELKIVHYVIRNLNGTTDEESITRFRVHRITPHGDSRNYFQMKTTIGTFGLKSHEMNVVNAILLLRIPVMAVPGVIVDSVLYPIYPKLMASG